MTTDTDVTTYRCLKTACHELCHVFGLTHCPYYECLMNGSNLLEEADRKPFMLCPICLRKIAVYLNFMDNIVTRYKQIHSNLVFM
jgi:archaemetzincin